MKAITVINRSQEVSDREFNNLFDELVPQSGKADTKAGEILRAMAKFAYRYFNDGDMFGVGYGKKTVNPAGRFLCNKLSEIAYTLWAMYGSFNETEYEKKLLYIQNYVIDYILANPQLKEQANDEDYLDWRVAEEDVDDSYEDDEEEW